MPGGRLAARAPKGNTPPLPTRLAHVHQRSLGVARQQLQLARVDAHDPQQQLPGQAQRQRHFGGVEGLVDDGLCAWGPKVRPRGSGAAPIGRGRRERGPRGLAAPGPHCRRPAAGTAQAVPQRGSLGQAAGRAAHRRWRPGLSPQSGTCAAWRRWRCGRQSRWCPAGPAWTARTGSRTWGASAGGKAFNGARGGGGTGAAGLETQRAAAVGGERPAPSRGESHKKIVRHVSPCVSFPTSLECA